MFYCNPKKIVWEEELNKTSLGTFYPYKSKSGENLWMARVFHAKNNEDAIRHLNKTLLSFSCDHPSLVSTGGYFFEKIRAGWNICCKVSKMEGNLRDLIDSHSMVQSKISEKDILNCLYSLVSALEYLHQKGIAHRNINPENVFYDKNGQIKLGEIGPRMEPEDDDATFTISRSEHRARLYLPPEFLEQAPKQNKASLFKADSWSLGFVIKEMCSAGISFAEGELNDVGKTLQRLEKVYSKDLILILKSLLEVDVAKRGRVQDVRKKIMELFSSNIQTLNLCFSKETRKLSEKLEKQLENKGRKDSNNVEQNIDYSKLNQDKIIAQQKKIQDQAFFDKRLRFIKKEIEDKWQDYFIFDEEKPFAIEPVFTTKVTDSELKNFMTEIMQLLGKKDLHCLDTFEFSLADCAQITDQGLEDLSKNFRDHLNNLQSISLNLTDCEEIGDKGLKALSYQIETSLKNLHSLDLNFTNCNKITNEGVKSLSLSIANNSQTLERLSLNFDGCKKITEDGIKAITSNVNHSFEELKELCLNFSSCTDLKDKTILELMRNIQCGSNSLSMPSQERSPVRKENLGGKKLENLNLYFGFSKITDAAFQELISCIYSDFKNLTKLELNLEVCFGLTDVGVGVLASHFESGFKKLESLSLNFAWCTRISDKSFKQLVRNIKIALPNIKSLQMSFYQCDAVTEEAKAAARKLLSHIPQLSVC